MQLLYLIIPSLIVVYLTKNSRKGTESESVTDRDFSDERRSSGRSSARSSASLSRLPRPSSSSSILHENWKSVRKAEMASEGRKVGWKLQDPEAVYEFEIGDEDFGTFHPSRGFKTVKRHLNGKPGQASEYKERKRNVPGTSMYQNWIQNNPGGAAAANARDP